MVSALELQKWLKDEEDNLLLDFAKVTDFKSIALKSIDRIYKTEKWFGKTDEEGNKILKEIYEGVIDGKSVRFPKSVLNQISILLKEKPDLKFIKVVSTGTGLKTKYMVMEAKP